MYISIYVDPMYPIKSLKVELPGLWETCGLTSDRAVQGHVRALAHGFVNLRQLEVGLQAE